MTENKSVNIYNGIRNDLKISIDDIFDVIFLILEDIKKLKLAAFKPEGKTAAALLEYLSWEDGKNKSNFELAF